MSDAPLSPLYQTLDELALVLRHERDALTKLDRDAIASAAEHKLQLNELLRSQFAQVEATPELVARVTEVREAARLNQLLLVHARSCVQSMLQLLTGRMESPVPRAGAVPPLPVALDVRG